MTADALDSAKAAAQGDDVSASLMFGQIATVEALRDLTKIGAGILAHLKQQDDIELEVAQEKHQLAAVLRASWTRAHRGLPFGSLPEDVWEYVAERAIEWLNLTPSTGDPK
ncbi:hypothetical protein AB0362_12940 [Rhodococcus sp. NPDC079359]|uniref:hypothetical protein n=1 Tax=Rhodococcus sp. NPDC079359 TaxID=3154961 RepID=UPI00344CD70D